LGDRENVLVPIFKDGWMLKTYDFDDIKAQAAKGVEEINRKILIDACA